MDWLFEVLFGSCPLFEGGVYQVYDEAPFIVAFCPSPLSSTPLRTVEGSPSYRALVHYNGWAGWSGSSLKSVNCQLQTKCEVVALSISQQM